MKQAGRGYRWSLSGSGERQSAAVTTTSRRVPMQGMTQARWDALSASERDALRDDSGLSPQLRGLEGWRVEVVTTYGETRRFIVSRSTGWKPCHIELPQRNSRSGHGAEREYASVRKLYRAAQR